MYNLSTFRSTVLRPQLASRFIVTLPSLTEYLDQPSERSSVDRISLLTAQDVQFPNYENSPKRTVKRYGMGLDDRHASSPATKEVVITFINVEVGERYRWFHKWLQNCVNHDLNTCSYKDLYSHEIRIRPLTTTSTDQQTTQDSLFKKEYDIVLEKAFPIAIMGETFDWRQVDKYHTISVTFDYYKLRIEKQQD